MLRCDGTFRAWKQGNVPLVAVPYAAELRGSTQRLFPFQTYPRACSEISKRHFGQESHSAHAKLKWVGSPKRGGLSESVVRPSPSSARYLETIAGVVSFSARGCHCAIVGW